MISGSYLTSQYIRLGDRSKRYFTLHYVTLRWITYNLFPKPNISFSKISKNKLVTLNTRFEGLGPRICPTFKIQQEIEIKYFHLFAVPSSLISIFRMRYLQMACPSVSHFTDVRRTFKPPTPVFRSGGRGGNERLHWWQTDLDGWLPISLS